MITGINHITLSVRDVDRSYQFYVETLGARPLARWSKGAYLLAGAGATAGLLSATTGH